MGATPAEPILAIGADGAPGGWAVAVAHAGATALHLAADVWEVAALRDAGGGRAPVAIDIPIGLLDSVDLRPCDRAARAALRPHASRVFAPPSRPMLAAGGDFAAIQALVADERVTAPAAKGLSRQSAGIAAKVAAVDAFARATKGSDGWLFECHPELSFAAMAGGRPLPAKASAAGLVARLRLLRNAFPDAQERLAGAPWPARRAGPLDLVDAYGALWTALRIARRHHRLLGGERDGRGLPMRMAV